MEYDEWKEKILNGNRFGLLSVPPFHFVGKIDIKKCECITKDILTSNVIITNERINHINSRHKNAYDKFSSFIPEILKSPEYILEDEAGRTAILLKESKTTGKKFELILRVALKNDPLGYENSIITFWDIGEKSWERNIKKKKILYKDP